MDKEELQKRIDLRIKDLRLEKRISQQKLASLCDFEKSNMARLEAGNTNPTVFTLYKIASALNVPLADLLRIE